ncbi:MAG: allophanate hydrolase [Betaproteobacteria bacterium]
MGCFKLVQKYLSANTDPAAQGASQAAWIHRLSSPLPGSAQGPLAGLSFAVKDNIDVAGLPTTAGCPAFSHAVSASAVVVQRLLQAGACLQGKTNMDQFACGLNGTRSPYGAVPNAFDSRYISGGSSAGSAYVVASGEVDFALGTDTAGSGRVPAGLNNIVGLKPSRGLISTRGVLPAAQSVDVVSIFARSVPMAWRVLAAAAAHDAHDPYSRSLALQTAPFPKSLRFGVPRELEFFGDEQSQAQFELAVQRMQSLGGQAVPFDYAPFAQAAALLYDSALVAERYAAIRDFFDANEEQVIEPVRSIIAQGRTYSAADVFEAQLKLKALAQQLEPVWSQFDCMMVPTAPTHYTIAQMQSDPVVLNRRLGAYTNFVNLLDYAALSVPSSVRADGLPFGITLIGPCGSDWALAELGQRYHHASGLSLGATGHSLGSIEPLPAPPPDERQARIQVAVVGAHLSGMPLNWQLTERAGRCLRAAHTSPDYRLFALPGTVPPKPGLLRVAPGQGAAIALEIWDMPVAHYGSFVALIPAPLGIGSVSLDDGSQVQGFLCESQALTDAKDITHLGGWRAYMREHLAAGQA